MDEDGRLRRGQKLEGNEGGAAVRTPSGSGSGSSADTPLSDAPTLVPISNTSESEAPTLVPFTPLSPSDAPTIIGEAPSPLTPQPPLPTPNRKTPPPTQEHHKAQAVLNDGTVLANRYQIVQTLGEGGMGAVYKARDLELDRLVALKVIRPDLARNPDIIDRFKQELLLSQRVTHRNVIRIYDLGEGDGVKFITMEYIEGHDLRGLIRERKKLPPVEAIEIMQQVCLALDAAHSVGVIHRDLKPQNIMLDQTGRVLVMDFGLARTLEGSGMTQAGALVGTMEYMSPEQALGSNLDQRSDLFSAGLIFFELLTGQVPFHAQSAVASLIRRTRERAVPISDLDASIPPSLTAIVSKCLERDVNLRYQSAKDLVADLEAWDSTRGSTKMAAQSFRRGAYRLREVSWKRVTVIALTMALIAVATWFIERRGRVSVTGQHAPVSVLVADFKNNTSDPLFEDTLEPMVNVALEGAGFINAYSRGTARQLAGKLPNPTTKLDDNSARLVAVNEGVAAIVTGSLSTRGSGYNLALTAVDAVTGKTLASASANIANKDQLLLDIPKVIAPIRQALGDSTPQSQQIEKAAGAFTTSSLAAVHQYGIAMDQLLAGNSEQAIQSFSNAIALDPNFARAYGGMASAYGNLGKTQDAEKYVKLAMEHVDRMTERERYRVRGLYYYATSNYPKCIEEYGELVKRFPADDSGWANIAACYISLRRIPEAVAAAQRAVEIVPKGAIQRVVLSFYSSYGGDFIAGEREAQTALNLNPSFLAYLALAESQLGLGQMDQAAETYQKMEKIDATGASLAASGLADIASYQGRYADAVRILEQGVAADVAAKNADNAAEKVAGIAEIQLLRGQKESGVATASKALSMSHAVPVRVLAAQALLDAGEIVRAQKLADGLASEVQPETQAYAKIIDGGLALKRGDKNEAIKMFSDANQLLDTWIGRFELGRAYLEAGQFVEADSEFDRCLKRRGEALEIFQDNVPTFAYVVPNYYYVGRVREGLKSPGFAEPYHTYLNIRGKANEDPLLADIRRRLAQ